MSLTTADLGNNMGDDMLLSVDFCLYNNWLSHLMWGLWEFPWDDGLAYFDAATEMPCGVPR